MNRAAYVEPKRPFRPVGDVAPSNLTRQLSADQDKANCLILECGDIRNILFTIFCNAKGWPQYSIMAEFDFRSPQI